MLKLRRLTYRLIRIGVILTGTLLACVIFAHFFTVLQNISYAHNYFADRLSYTNVLATRKWHPLISDKVFDCTYAVVSITKEAAHHPPVKWQGIVEWSHTPVVLIRTKHVPYTSEPISDCVEINAWVPDVEEKLLKAIREPGSYYIRRGDTILVYSRPQNIAARVRFGD